ncbi:MAG TPA: CBS domain-containing protein, partial [Rhodobacterales bacterium]|nr:CBS domain-containing protein [Rhodobacterales bacterium]
VGIEGYISGGPTAAGVNILYILLLFACVIAHDFGHALMARRFGIRTPDVTLLPIGGLARLERMPEKPGQEILVALAGPAVNVVIFLGLWLVLGTDRLTSVDQSQITMADLAAQIAIVNFILAVFNLIPAFPMDGGRVLRATLSAMTSRQAATRAAAAAGQGVAFAMGLAGLVSANPLLLLIAVFIFFSAGAESTQESLETLAHSLLARDAMITEFESLRPDDSLDVAAKTLIRTTQHEFPVVHPVSGEALGLLTRASLYGALQASLRPRSVSEVMQKDLPILSPRAPLKDVLAALGEGVPAVGIKGPTGALLGYVTRENLGELMVVAGSQAV